MNGFSIKRGLFLNTIIKFCTSKDGMVALGAIVLLAVVSHYNTENPWINLLARVGNLLVFVYIIWRAAGRGIANFFAGRRAAIASELENLGKRKEDAESNLARLQERIANLDAECETILTESRAQGEALKQAILAKAEMDAAQIRAQATRAAGSEAKTVLMALRAELADEITLAIEQGLTKRLSAGEHTKLIDNSLKKVVLN